jgi:hypothetical protein
MMPSNVSEEDMAAINHPDSRPDITMRTTDDTDGTPRHKYTFIEIKYCVDTKPCDQHNKARAQHARLMSTIESAPNTQAELVIILLGTAGYIYNNMHEQLRKVGVQGRALASLTTNLHVQAVKSLAGIIGTRRHQERKQNKRKLYYSQNRASAVHATSNANQSTTNLKTKPTSKRRKVHNTGPTRSRRKRKKT